MDRAMASSLGSRRCGSAALVALVCALLAVPAAGQSIVEERPLSFGRLAIASNVMAGSVTIGSNGTTTTTGSVISVVRGTPGRYRITGLPAQSPVSLSYASTPLYRGGMAGGPVYLSIDAVLAPATAVTDGTGTANIELGATLMTSGDGNPYGDGSYQGDILITVTVP